MDERVGVFGGTFDPVHVGHLASAVAVRHALGLDRILLVVAAEPWQKVGSRAVSPAEDRFAVVEAAVAGIAGLEASRIELDRGGPSYTADTLAALSTPGRELALVLGADAAAGLRTWERVDEVGTLARLVVTTRPGSGRPAVPAGWRVDFVEVPALDVSSTELRDWAATGRPLDVLVPPAALREARRRGLYPGPVSQTPSGDT